MAREGVVYVLLPRAILDPPPPPTMGRPPMVQIEAEMGPIRAVVSSIMSQLGPQTPCFIERDGLDPTDCTSVARIIWPLIRHIFRRSLDLDHTLPRSGVLVTP